jgi:hypothetical protein
MVIDGRPYLAVGDKWRSGLGGPGRCAVRLADLPLSIKATVALLSTVMDGGLRDQGALNEQRFMDTDERAKITESLAANAITTANAYAALFQALLGVLRDNNILSHSKIELVFRGAAAQIDAMQPQGELQKTAQQAMRNQIEQIAASSGIQIPPPGQTGMRRKH